MYSSLKKHLSFAIARSQKATKLYHNRTGEIEQIYIWKPMTIGLSM